MEKQKLNANQSIIKGVQTFAKANSISYSKAKPNAEASRLMAMTTYEYNSMDSVNQPMDSISFFWHDLLGKDFNYLDYLGYNPLTLYSFTPAEEVAYENVGLDSYFNYSWDSIAFELTGMHLQTFDDYNVKSSESYLIEDGVRSINQLIDNTYSNGMLTASNTAYYSGSNWDFSRNVYTYDTNGNLLVALSEYDYVDTFEYDAQNNVTLKTSYNYSGGTWYPDRKHEYTYNAGNRESDIYYNWDGSNWQEDNQEFYVYDSNRLVRNYYLDWNNVTNQWDSSSRYDYSYNNSNLADTKTAYSYDGTNWVENYRYIGIYNDKDLLVEIIEQDWNDMDTLWENEEKANYTYNDFDQAILVDEYTIWNAVDSVWEKDHNDDRYDFYYELFDDGVSIKNINKIDFNIYPNPANETININTGNTQINAIVIYDNAGRVVMQQRYGAGAQGELSIGVSNLTSGAYHISIIGKNATGTKTFVKQ